MSETQKELIERAAGGEGMVVERWDEEHLNGLTAIFKHKWRVISDEYDDEGLYEGDVGVLTACVVGAPEYHNQRVSYSFVVDGEDEGREVRDLSVFDADE